jgi:putative acetyltransferase
MNGTSYEWMSAVRQTLGDSRRARSAADWRGVGGGHPIIAVREEQPDDVVAVRRVNDAAFGRATEGSIVDRLRRECGELLSWVAEDRDGSVIGYVLFSPVTVVRDGRRDSVRGLGLGPLAVLPSCQRRGVGSALVRHGLAAAGIRGAAFVVVVGYSGYFPRFGFEPASWQGVRCPWTRIPDDAFMIKILDPDVMHEVRGVARYRDEFMVGR